MNKENPVTVNVGGTTVRVTRARAASVGCSGGIHPSDIPKQNQNRILRSKSKRAALDEGNNNASFTAAVQQKKKAVLKDVTNIHCESSKNCLIAAKLPKKNSKQAKKSSANMPRVAHSIEGDIPQHPADLETKVAQEVVRTHQDECAAQLESNRPCQTVIAVEGCAIDSQLTKQNLEMPLKLTKCLKRGDNLGIFGKLRKSSNLTETDSDHKGITDIDSDLKDSQLCSLYAPDLYNNLRVAELLRRPLANFMETVQRDITQCMRGILVDWLVEVSEEHKLAPDTLYLTVSLIDLFLSHNYIERQILQLLGITCMLIAAKYEEICAPRVEELCFITDNTYTRGQVVEMESRVLNYLRFQLSVPTAKTFLRRFLRAAQACYKTPSFELEYLANYLAELTLVDYEFLRFLPSLIAASAVFLARWTLDQSGHPWNSTLEFYTNYKASELKIPVNALRGLQLNTNNCPLNAIRSKYKQDKCNSVASVSSPELLQTLFQR